MNKKEDLLVYLLDEIISEIILNSSYVEIKDYKNKIVIQLHTKSFQGRIVKAAKKGKPPLKIIKNC